MRSQYTIDHDDRQQQGRSGHVEKFHLLHAFEGHIEEGEHIAIRPKV